MLPQLHKQICYVDECVALLTKHVNNETYEAYITTYCQEHGIARELVAPLFDAPIAVAQHVISGLNIPQDQLHRMFDQNGKDDYSIADLIVYTYYEVTTQIIVKRIEQFTPRQRLEHLYRIIVGAQEHRIIDNDCIPQDLSMDMLLHMILRGRDENAELALRLIDFCLNMDQLVAQFTQMIDQATVLFQQKEHLVLPQLQAVWEHMEQAIEIKGMDLVTDLMPMSGKFTRPYHVYVSAMMPHNLRYGIALDNASEHLTVGVSVLALEELEKQHENTFAAADVFKSLGDKTKLDILQALRTRSMYGQELATLLNLSTATISYHMNLLLNHDFVMVERENSRIYYQLNKPGLIRQLKRINKLLDLDRN